jgi:hypothetical protein
MRHDALRFLARAVVLWTGRTRSRAGDGIAQAQSAGIHMVSLLHHGVLGRRVTVAQPPLQWRASIANCMVARGTEEIRRRNQRVAE